MKRLLSHALAKLCLGLVLIVVSSCASTFDYSQLEALYQEADAIARTEGFIAPIAEREYRVIADEGFGFKRHPFLGTIYFNRYAWLFCRIGTELVAVCDGQITNIGRDGTMQTLTVKSGDFTITYAKIIPANGLKPGMTITKGSVLGKLGYGFDSSGPRLYLAISYKNVRLDAALILNLKSRSSDSDDDPDEAADDTDSNTESDATSD